MLKCIYSFHFNLNMRSIEHECVLFAWKNYITYILFPSKQIIYNNIYNFKKANIYLFA